MQNESLKKLFFIVGVSAVLYILFRPKGNKESLLSSFGKNKKGGAIKKPLIDDEDLQHDEIRLSYEALCAYIDAYNDGESESSLQAIKDGFKEEMGIEIYTDPSGKLAVKNLAGDDILVNS